MDKEYLEEVLGVPKELEIESIEEDIVEGHIHFVLRRKK